MPSCPQCHKNIPPGVGCCPLCGADLTKSRRKPLLFGRETMDGPPWPMDESGREMRAVTAFTSQDPVEVQLKAALLHAYAIPAFSDRPNTVLFGTVVFGGSASGAHVYVPVDRQAEAQDILSASFLEETPNNSEEEQQ